jgi:hypothetical protein
MILVGGRPFLTISLGVYADEITRFAYEYPGVDDRGPQYYVKTTVADGLAYAVDLAPLLFPAAAEAAP